MPLRFAPVLFLALGGALSVPALAQTIEWRTLGQALSDQRPEQPPMATGLGARLRGLDKVSGALTDLSVANGDSAVLGRLRLTVGECRYPAENPESEAFAWLTITDAVDGETLFSGWMIASSPALNALDHARYDVWLLECDRPEG